MNGVDQSLAQSRLRSKRPLTRTTETDGERRFFNSLMIHLEWMVLGSSGAHERHSPADSVVEVVTDAV